MVQFKNNRRSQALLVVVLFVASGVAFEAQASLRSTITAFANGQTFSLGNRYLEARGKVQSGRWAGLQIVDRANGHFVDLAEAFSFTFQDKSVLRSSDMNLSQPFAVNELPPDPNAARYSEQLAGKAVCAEFTDRKGSMRVEWCGILRDGSNYFRQKITIQAKANPLPIAEVRLLSFSDSGARVVGMVKGSPIVDATMFFGFEYPLSTSQVNHGVASASLARELPILAEHCVSYSSVVGVASAGQMRRDFLRYIERERAHPYRPFLQYNSWYDLSYNTLYTEAAALDRIRAFGTELTERRGVIIRSFVFDDGWNNPNSFWKFNSGFPDGFHKVSEAAAQYHTYIGVWLSPWGGYDKAKQQRVVFGQRLGYEVIDGGFALSGPKYYAGFEKTCLNMIHNYGVNEFKLDGTGNADRVFPGSEFDSDFDATIHLIHRLRQAEPDIFINLSTGTWPSPFWLSTTDSVWRGGQDHAFAGAGTSRQRWITYRDAQVYKNIVKAGPLFPLNSLMLSGIIDARLAQGLSGDDADFRDEVETFFGSGTQVQEMYITPSLLTQHDWKLLAKGAKWSLQNAETLKDTHWIGGDPAQLRVYGWAAWSPKKAIIVLRNPSDEPQTYSLDIQQALELPGSAQRAYVSHDPWNQADLKTITLRAGHTLSIQLKPWEVRTLDATPVSR